AMLKLTPILLALLGTAAALPAWAAADTKVLNHHVANMKSGNLEGVLSDYSPDAVVVTPAGMITPDGVFVGAEARKLFSVLTDKDHLPGNKTMQSRYQSAGADTSVMQWAQFKGTPKEVSGYDVFVVRGGKIVFQTVIVNAAKK
ncbi:MAG TPA: nuclear transport factor 2 family protein, partial [Rhizomicrobium sp.]|nr:nuclear transport factor 2 family protein [Rhizomicrobium sp.]